MTSITAAKIVVGDQVDTDAGPALVTHVARSKGGLFAPPPGAVCLTITNAGRELTLALKPGSRINVVRAS